MRTFNSEGTANIVSATVSANFIYRTMTMILSEFHYSLTFIDGACFRSPGEVHAEFPFKLLAAMPVVTRECTSANPKPLFPADRCLPMEFPQRRRVLMMVSSLKARLCS
jgi:hypothetical protein